MFEDKFYNNEDPGKYRFLVTGGAGFIGSNLVEYLLRHGAGKVRVLDNLFSGYQKNIEPFLANPAIEFIHGDIRDIDTCEKACEGIDYVFHEAALGSVPRSIADPALTNAINITGFLNMLIAARDKKVKRLIYAASSSTYGDSVNLPKVEDEIGKPLSPYAVTKYVNELYADVFSKTYGMEVIGLRYFNVYGPRQSPKGAYAAVIPLFIDAVLNEKAPIIYGDGNQTRDFTFVEDAVQSNIRAAFAEKEALNKVYNVAVGERTTLNEMFEILRAIGETDLKPRYDPPRTGDIRDSLADISRAKNLLGYNPKVKIREGLEKTFIWFKENIDFVNKE